MSKMLKRAVAALFALSTVASGIVAPATTVSAAWEETGTELTAFGDFEGYEPGYLFDKAYHDGEQVQVDATAVGEITDEEAKDGDYSLKLSDGNAPASGTWTHNINYHVNVTAGYKYVWTVDIMAPAETESKVGGSMTVLDADYLDGGSGWASAHVTSLSSKDMRGVWQTYTVEYIAASTKTNARFHIDMNPSGTVQYVDNFSIKEYAPKYNNGKELMPDGDFETGNADANGGSMTTGNSTKSIETEYVNTGSYALKLTNNGAGNTSWNYYISMTKDHRYEFTVAISGTPGGEYGNGTSVNIMTQGWTSIPAQEVVTGAQLASGYTVHTLTYTATQDWPAGGGVRCNVNFAAGTGDIYIDSISVKEYAPAAEETGAIYHQDFDSLTTGADVQDVEQLSHTSNSSIEVVSDVYRGDSGKSAKVTNNATSMSTIRVNGVNFKAGYDYLFSAWIKASPDNQKALENDFYIIDPTTHYYVNKARGKAHLDIGQDWTCISAVYHMTADVMGGKDETQLQVIMSSTGAVDDVWYVDDINIYEIENTDDLFINGGYEMGDVGTDFSYAANNAVGFTVSGGNAGSSAVITDEEAHTGAHSLKVTGGDTVNGVINVKINIEAGVTYIVSGYIKGTPGMGSSKPAQLRIIPEGAGNKYHRLVPVFSVSPDGSQWTYAHYVFTARETGTARLNLYLNGTNGNKVFYIDDMSIKAMGNGETGAAGNMIPSNASNFETMGAITDGVLTEAGKTSIDYSDIFVISGNYSLCLVNNYDTAPNSADTAEDPINQSISYTGLSFDKDMEYKLTFKEASSSGNGTVGNVKIEFIDNSDGSVFAEKLSDAIGGEAWKRVEESMTFTPDKAVADATLKISYMDNREGNAEIMYFIDDVVLKKNTAVPQGELMINGTFENPPASLASFIKPQAADVTYSTEYAHGGEYSLKIAGRIPHSSVIFEVPVDLENGTEVKFSCYTLVDEDPITTATYLHEYAIDANKTYSTQRQAGWLYNDIKTKVADGKVRVQVKAPPQTSDANEKHTFFIDDVSIKVYSEGVSPFPDVKSVKITNAQLMYYDEDDGSLLPAENTFVGAYEYDYIVNVSNTTDEDVSVTPVLALYDAEGRLVQVEYSEGTAAAGNTDNEISAIMYVTDVEPGMYFKTFVWDGVDGMKPIDRKIKVLIIGNSITQHNPSAGIGWLGDWGMAATSREKDYVHRLMALVNENYDNIEIECKNVADFERAFYSINRTSITNIYSYYPNREYDADIIITTFGANVKNSLNENDPSFETDREFRVEDYKGIVDFFNANGTAKVIVGVTPLTNDTIASVLRSAGVTYDLPVVDMTALKGDEYTAKNYIEEGIASGAFNENINNPVGTGVVGHPGDKAMAEMAQMLYPALSNAIDSLRN